MELWWIKTLYIVLYSEQVLMHLWYWAPTGLETKARKLLWGDG